MIQKSRFSKLLLLLIAHHHILCVLCADSRIAGGEQCNDDLYPYAVAVGLSSLMCICGGTLISLEWILTNALCVHLIETAPKTEKLILRTGFSRDERFVQLRYVKRSVAHEKYNCINQKNNIGLLLADKPFDQTAYLKPAKLPDPGFLSKCRKATAIGVAKEIKRAPNERPTTKSAKLNDPLLCVELSIFSRNRCSEIYEPFSNFRIDESVICTLDEEGKRDICLKDRGFPLVWQGVVIGLPSSGAGCAQPNFPRVSTNVEYFLDFIFNVIKPEPTEKQSNGSEKLVPGKVFVIVVVFLFYILMNKFGCA